ncbi:MAG TPA: hypothetical protein VIW46_06355 [Acidimicrobiia bacterium]|jgi:hypothetical protein
MAGFIWNLAAWYRSDHVDDGLGSEYLLSRRLVAVGAGHVTATTLLASPTVPRRQSLRIGEGSSSVVAA